MSAETKAILYGSHGVDEISAWLEQRYLKDGKAEIRQRSDSGSFIGTISFSEAKTGNPRTIHVFDGRETSDDRDVYSGDRTLISCGASGDSVMFMTTILSVCGGLLKRNDSDSSDNWVSVSPESGSDLSPDQVLKISLCRVLSPQEAEIMRSIVDNPQVREVVFDAISVYRDHSSKSVFTI